MLVEEKEITRRREEETSKGKDAFKPRGRDRKISKALQIYSFLASSADKGAVRKLPEDI